MAYRFAFVHPCVNPYFVSHLLLKKAFRPLDPLQEAEFTRLLVTMMYWPLIILINKNFIISQL